MKKCPTCGHEVGEADAKATIPSKSKALVDALRKVPDPEAEARTRGGYSKAHGAGTG